MRDPGCRHCEINPSAEYCCILMTLTLLSSPLYSQTAPVSCIYQLQHPIVGYIESAEQSRTTEHFWLAAYSASKSDNKPVWIIFCQWKSYSANISHILPARVTISQYKPCSANGSHILMVEVIFCQQKLNSTSIIMFCQYKSYSASISDILPILVTFCNHVLSKLSAV